MKLHYNLFNHSKLGQASLHDPIGILGHQLRALGHEVSWDQKNQQIIRKEQGYNIVVEGFTPGEFGSIVHIERLYKEGARFICLATEEPSDKGFNQGTQKEMVLRQEYFCEAAKYFDGIIHLVPGQHVTDWYGQFCPAAYAELGYAPTLVRPYSSADDNPPWDFGFFGSLSKRRLKILKTLSRRIGTQCAVRVVANFPSQDERDRIIRSSKVVTQVRKFEAMGLVSSSRINTALCCGRPVIAEPHLLSKPWDEIVKFSETLDQFYNDAIGVRIAWRGVHEAQFCKFKELLTPWKCIGEPLERLGIKSPLRRAA